MNNKIEDIRDKKMSEFGKIGADDAAKKAFGKVLEVAKEEAAPILEEAKEKIAEITTPDPIKTEIPEPLTSNNETTVETEAAASTDEEKIATAPTFNESSPAPSPAFTENKAEVAAHEITESAADMVEDLADEAQAKAEVQEIDAELQGGPAVGQKKGSKFTLIIVVIIALLTAGYFAYTLLDLPTQEAPEETIINTPPPAPEFIDNGESHNKFLKDNPDAKAANINIFDFDINACLQKFSDDECINMYSDSLKLLER